MIATSHGLIWRDHLGDIIGAYKRWAANETLPKAVIIYDTMWHSTEKMAWALREGLEAEGVPTMMGNLGTSHISDIMTHVLEARGILIGTPTLNARMFPTVTAAMTYIAGLRPENRLGLAFGSYGWGKQGVRDVAEAIKQMGWGTPVEEVAVQWVPGADDLARVREAGAEFARAVKGEQTAQDE
jgi:flavorubredoxin